MEPKSTIITVTPIARPKRKLIVLRSKQAEDYLSFCNEMGCDWAGLFNSIPEKIDTEAEGPASVLFAVDTDGVEDVGDGRNMAWTTEDRERRTDNRRRRMAGRGDACVARDASDEIRDTNSGGRS